MRGAGLCGERSNVPRRCAALYGAEDLVKVNGHFFAKLFVHFARTNRGAPVQLKLKTINDNPYLSISVKR